MMRGARGGNPCAENARAARPRLQPTPAKPKTAQALWAPGRASAALLRRRPGGRRGAANTRTARAGLWLLLLRFTATRATTSARACATPRHATPHTARARACVPAHACVSVCVRLGESSPALQVWVAGCVCQARARGIVAATCVQRQGLRPRRTAVRACQPPAPAPLGWGSPRCVRVAAQHGVPQRRARHRPWCSSGRTPATAGGDAGVRQRARARVGVCSHARTHARTHAQAPCPATTSSST
jgi:hypothetical protein